MHNNHCHRVTAHLQSNILLLLLLLLYNTCLLKTQLKLRVYDFEKVNMSRNM